MASLANKRVSTPAKRAALARYLLTPKGQATRERYRKSPGGKAAHQRSYEKAITSRLEYVLKYLETHPCVDCDEADPLVLEFDHRDPTTKAKDVSLLIRQAALLSRIVEEIAKCDVRCCNCHRRKHMLEGGFYRTLVVKEKEMSDRHEFELVKDSGDSANEIREIDVCVYGIEHYPKGYSRVSHMGEMPEGGAYRADWHPQGANFRGNWRDDTNPADADKPADKL